MSNWMRAQIQRRLDRDLTPTVRRSEPMPDILELPSTALAPTEKATPLPVFTSVEMVNALNQYRALQRALDESMPDQVMRLDGKPFRKKGYWRAIAVAFNLNVELEAERREIYGQLPDDGDNYAWMVTYRATAANGRTDTGDGACTASEKSKGRLRPSEHNVRSHAHTRAYNRAVSNLVGFGEVSAEEIDREGDVPTRRPEKRAVENAADLLITTPDRERLFTIAKDSGWKKPEVLEFLKREYQIEDTKQIRRTQYEAIISAIQAGGKE
jgi:hypothetical protein